MVSGQVLKFVVESLNFLLNYLILPLQSDGFPTLLFFPAGNKGLDPVSGHSRDHMFVFSSSALDFILNMGYLLWQITVDSDRTVKALYKFIKKHAAIPFKLEKPTSTPSEGSDAKDEL